MKYFTGFVVILLIVYTGVAFFPLAHVPYTLDGKMRDVCKEWLKIPRPQRTAKMLSNFKDSVEQTITDYLQGHTWDKKDLKITAATNSVSAQISLPYTIVIHFFGQQFTFDKELEIKETAWHF